ncbi:hypothetical protein F5Y06DRAFT_100611 [Hypoxylon sp. FL0890]|nr:hypothetical protein F5Y06DRAFT_100611 [Hypoxylon sp. FL0890]
MDWDEYILKQCQFEECEATILIRGPYCTKHSYCKGLPKLAPIRKPSSITATMEPQGEKLGDAITVKTPLAPLGHMGEKSEKKQLSDKKTARKTTTSGASKSKPIPATTRNPDFRPSLDRIPVGDATSSDQRPLKRPRLNTDIGEEERRAHHHVPSPAESVSRTPFGIKPVPADPGDLGSAAASDFALRPQKGNSASMEMSPLPRPRSREDRVPSISRTSHKAPPRKHQAPNSIPKNHGFPTHGVIDLTMDDDSGPQFANKERENLHSNTQKIQDNRPTGSSARAGPSLSGPQNEENSIEVQFTPNGGANKSTSPVNTTNRNDQNHVRKKTNSNLAPRQPPNKTPVTIAPRRVETLLPPGFFESQRFRSILDDNQMTPQYPQQPQPPAERPVYVPRQNGIQVQETGLVTTSTEEPRTFSPAAVNRLPTVPPATNHIPRGPPGPGPTTTSSTLSTSGGFVASQYTLSAQIDEYVRGIVERFNKTKGSCTAHDSRTTHSGVPISQPDSGQIHSSIRSSQSRESASKTQTPVDSQVVNSHTPLLQRDHVMQKTSQPPVVSSEENVEHSNGTLLCADKPANEPTLGSKVRSPSWRRLELEKKRQALISNHDPGKFDSYIYGENNEPFRPGSALFGLPPKFQPLRPTLPAPHFAYIDPRIHWTFPRSEKWHHQKQKEIRERGNRKRNFGQAAARAARRKRERGNTRVELPERVKNNPKWMAALDELDGMAEQYHAEKREEYNDLKEREERLKKRIQKGKERETVIFNGYEDEEMEDAFEERNHLETPDNHTWFFIRKT